MNPAAGVLSRRPGRPGRPTPQERAPPLTVECTGWKFGMCRRAALKKSGQRFHVGSRSSAPSRTAARIAAARARKWIGRKRRIDPVDGIELRGGDERVIRVEGTGANERPAARPPREGFARQVSAKPTSMSWSATGEPAG
jgi:hypothetical protein